MSFSLDEEVRLYTTNAERERLGLRATLFGLVTALDFLERAYVRDAVPAAECVLFSVLSGALQADNGVERYAPACTRLLSQYKTMLGLVGDDLGGQGIEGFMARYRVRTCHLLVVSSAGRRVPVPDGSSRRAPSYTGGRAGDSRALFRGGP
jgi:ESCRT-I complex subunit VPS28